MKYFLGLDIALMNNGICLLNDNLDKVICEVFTPKKDSSIEEKINQINNKIYSIIYKHQNGLQLINLEGLSYGSAGRSFSEICGVHYCLRNMLFNNNFIDMLEIIEPTKLKKFITGKGQCKKELMLLNVYKKFGEEFDNDNLADSYGLARMALENYKNNED